MQNLALFKTQTKKGHPSRCAGVPQMRKTPGQQIVLGYHLSDSVSTELEPLRLAR